LQRPDIKQYRKLLGDIDNKTIWGIDKKTKNQQCYFLVMKILNTLKCPMCDYELEGNDDYCQYCGEKIIKTDKPRR